MTCTACPRAHTVTLATGSTCCTWCEPHRQECEARDILAMPTRNGRQARIARVGVVRTPEAEKSLRVVVMKLWELQRTK